jgi:hypothetical protein
MRPEYDIRGGVRGKYLDRYKAGVHVRIILEQSTLVVTSTAGAQQIGSSITLAAPSYLPPDPSPRIQLGAVKQDVA